jgi:hypothetical protein
MLPSLDSVVCRQVRLERELFVWRLLVAIIAAGAMLAAAAPQSEREIRLSSADSKNTVILSAEGLSLQRGGRVLAHLTFETVGDGDQQIALLKLNGEVNVESGIISVGPPLKQRAAIRPEGFSLVQGGVVRAGISPGVLTLADSSGHTKAELVTDEQGLAGLSLIYDQKLIAELASAGRFNITDPPKRDSANLVLKDWGPDFKSRLITPSEDTTRGKPGDGKN